VSHRPRVAVTGLGAITPIGNDVASFWEALIAGKSGIGTITQFDPSQFDCKIAAEVKGFDAADHLDKKEVRRVERFAQFAMVVARQAYAQSCLKTSGIDLCDVGVVMGCGIGGIGFIEESCNTLRERGPTKISPFMIPKIIANIAPGHVAIDLGLKGPSLAIVTACAAGTHAIGEAAEMIRRGIAKAMIAGGTESAICPIAIAGFDTMKAVCQDSNENPPMASRPFDATRSGFVMGEGAGALILEEMEHARARGARILAEIVGYGLSSDAFHVTAPAPHGEGGARAMRWAVKESGLRPEDFGYINAHGTSTPLNDKLETEAIKTVFGDHARKLAISSNKSMIGHLLGAAGAVEAVATVKTLETQILPPTINYKNPDPECDLDYVPNTARKTSGLRAALSNSLGFGGHNSVVAIAAYDEGK
jgi:3-oxoacyl-[acyl-carrier-protein] synthase II